MKFSSQSEADTERFGQALGRALVPGSVVALCGPLGAGKTALVRSVALELGASEDEVRSPTFLTALEYQGRLPIVHMDLYRHELELPDRHWLAELLDGDAVALVEWFDFLGSEAPADVLRIEMEYGAAEQSRELSVTSKGARSSAVLGRLLVELAACQVEPLVADVSLEEMR